MPRRTDGGLTPPTPAGGPEPAPRVEKALTPRQVAFVHARTADASISNTAAAVKAGYSEATARVIASQLLADPKIQLAIAKRRDELVRQALDADDVVRGMMGGDEAMTQLTVFARADIGAVLPPDHPIAKLPPDVRATIKAVRPTRYGDVIELHDAMKATELIAKGAGRLRDALETRSLEAILAESCQLESAGAEPDAPRPVMTSAPTSDAPVPVPAVDRRADDPVRVAAPQPTRVPPATPAPAAAVTVRPALWSDPIEITVSRSTARTPERAHATTDFDPFE